MANKSIFRAFIADLRKRWKKELPSIQPLTEARENLPKASSFYAGVIRDTGMHVLLNFQHSNKSWSVGEFTINVVLTMDEHHPKMYSVRSSHGIFCFEEGYRRIGFLVGSKDKWWCLKENDGRIRTENWHPSSYGNEDVVLSEAVEDVTRDVLTALRLLDVPVEQP
jgi:hypothetical protein